MILFPLIQGRVVFVGPCVRPVSVCGSTTSPSCYRLSHALSAEGFRTAISVTGARGRLAAESRVSNIFGWYSLVGGAHFAQDLSATLTSAAGTSEGRS